MPSARAFGERRFEGFKVRPAHGLAVGHDAFVDLDDALVKLFGKDDLLGENVRPGLVGDAKRVAEAPGDDQQRAVALALEQRIGGDRGAHLDVTDAFGRDRRGLIDAEQVADALDGGIGIGFGVFRQKLALVQRAVGRAANDVGEGAAAVDPEIPGLGHGLLLQALFRSLRRVRRPDPVWRRMDPAAMDNGFGLRIMRIVGITSTFYRQNVSEICDPTEIPARE
jgi:hypothetical protein